jgi:hypothetical protein
MRSVFHGFGKDECEVEDNHSSPLTSEVSLVDHTVSHEHVCLTNCGSLSAALITVCLADDTRALCSPPNVMGAA